jgi:hypothetical protein
MLGELTTLGLCLNMKSIAIKNTHSAPESSAESKFGGESLSSA